MESKFEVLNAKIVKIDKSRKNQGTGTQFSQMALIPQIPYIGITLPPHCF